MVASATELEPGELRESGGGYVIGGIFVYYYNPPTFLHVMVGDNDSNSVAQDLCKAGNASDRPNESNDRNSEVDESQKR